MDEIGFDAASIGVMAAAYAVVVPFLEIPSGILADRWSRRGVLVIAQLALSASALVGGLATNVSTYFVSALLLGVFFAMKSGTVEALVYDTVVEATGASDDFERVMGRVRAWESAALVTSALAGAGLAALTSPRVTYFLTVPFGIASVLALRFVDEPRLHKDGERLPLRVQIATTYRILLTSRSLRPVIATTVLAALLLQSLLEFGPLWMVALAASPLLYGPHWAGLMSSFGLGGALAGRVSLTRTSQLAAVAALLIAGSTLLAISHEVIVVIAAHVAVATVLVVVSTFLTHLLHDQVPSNVRAGVASGAGTLTWIVFMPFALVFGSTAQRSGVHSAAWLLVAVAALTSVSLIAVAARRPAVRSAAARATGVLPMPLQPCPDSDVALVPVAHAA